MSVQIPTVATVQATIETDSPNGVDQRQVFELGDPSTAANKAKILASGAQLVEPGGVNVQPVSGTVSTAPATSGGLGLPFHLVAAGGGDANTVKASPGQVYGWRIFNNSSAPIYVKLHNTAGTVTPGSGVVMTLGVQAGQQSEEISSLGIAFGTGIGLSIVTGLTDANSSGVSASACVVDLFYK